jgi:hypothetical protein
MGGWNSGRKRRTDSQTTDDALALDIRHLHQRKLLAHGNTFTWRWLEDGACVARIQGRVIRDNLALHYRYRQAGPWHAVRQPVSLNWTNCTLGGKRPWFICPLPQCGRRVALLYLADTTHFACRHCLRLTYASQHERQEDRLERKANRLRKRLGWAPGLLSPDGDKPKGMHWKTFDRIASACNDLSTTTGTHLDRKLAMALAAMHRAI